MSRLSGAVVADHRIRQRSFHSDRLAGSGELHAGRRTLACCSGFPEGGLTKSGILPPDTTDLVAVGLDRGFHSLARERLCLVQTPGIGSAVRVKRETKVRDVRMRRKPLLLLRNGRGIRLEKTQGIEHKVKDVVIQFPCQRQLHLLPGVVESLQSQQEVSLIFIGGNEIKTELLALTHCLQRFFILALPSIDKAQAVVWTESLADTARWSPEKLLPRAPNLP